MSQQADTVPADPFLLETHPRLHTEDFRVGKWLVRPRLNRLDNGTGSIHLEPRLVNLLIYFASHPRQVLTKEQIFATVWQSQYVADSALTRSIAELRRALGDDAHSPQFIETIPKRGYRMVAEVELPPPSAATKSAGQRVKPAPTPSASRRHRLLGWAAATLTLLGVVLTAFALTGFDLIGTEDTFTVSRVRSLAVLPFEDLSDPPLESNLTMAMTDALTNGLAQSEDLRVVSRRAVEEVQRPAASLAQIAGNLGVDAVVEGTIFRQEGRIRLHLQLTEAQDASLLWAESYEVNPAEILSIQRTIAEDLTRAVGQ